MDGHQILQQSMEQRSKVANPARGQLSREDEYFLSPFTPENLVHETGSAVPSCVSHT